MMKAENIKLIIWDLDDTFWEGTFSEGEIIIPEQNKQALLDALDIGIMNSICSKNEFSAIKTKLLEEKIWDYFVFPSIDWTTKGSRIKNIIETMKLRAENVLFIDDNPQNLEEAKYFCPTINILQAQEIPNLILQLKSLEKKDKTHKRLEQYHQMEKKEGERGQYSSNEEFLFSCDIRVEIKEDCLNEIDRIHELIMRSNQLNYTKDRPSKQELIRLLEENEVSSGYVKVRDKFGDYGLVGFYLLKKGKVVHYVFSCRTLGMKVEQFVYAKIGYPKIEVQGEVVSDLSLAESPKWIKQERKPVVEDNFKRNIVLKKRILLKGPCDMSQMYTFFDSGNEESIVTEFTYLSDGGVSIEGHNSTVQIATALYASEERKKEILSDVDFFDKAMLNTRLGEDFDVVVLSMLTDGNLGVYRRKETRELISFAEKKYPLDAKENASKYINNEIFTSGVKFTQEMLDSFSQAYEFVDNSDFKITMGALDKIYKKISADTIFILLLGSEKPFKKGCKPSFEDRHLEHKKMNSLIRIWAKGKANVSLISYDDYISSDADFLDTINHFTKKVYYNLAKDIISMINSEEESQFKLKGKGSLFKEVIKQKLRLIKNKMLKR